MIRFINSWYKISFSLLSSVLLEEGVNQLCSIRSFLPRYTYLAFVGRLKWNSLRLLTNALISDTSWNFKRWLWVLVFVIENNNNKVTSNCLLKHPNKGIVFLKSDNVRSILGNLKAPYWFAQVACYPMTSSLIGGGAENKAGRRRHLEQMMGELKNTKPLKTTEGLWGDHVSSQSNHGLWKHFPCLNWRQNFQVHGLCLFFTHSWRLHKAFIIYYIHNLPFSLVI